MTETLAATSRGRRRRSAARAAGWIRPREEGTQVRRRRSCRGTAKADRANEARQRREASRKGAWAARRGVGVGGSVAAEPPAVTPAVARAMSLPPPRIVGLISLSKSEGPLEERVRSALAGAAGRSVRSPGDGSGPAASVTEAYDAHARGGRTHVTLLTNRGSFCPQYSGRYGEGDASVQGALDLCRVCAAVLFLVDGSAAVSSHGRVPAGAEGGADTVGCDRGAVASGKKSNTTAHLDHLMSGRGDRVLAAVKAQGLPIPTVVVVHSGGAGPGGGGESLLVR